MTEHYITISSNNIQLSIASNVIDIWKKYRQVNADMHESFGVMIGSQENEPVSVVIEDVTTPLPKDRHSRSNFLLIDKGHQKTVDAAFKKSNGALGYLGTWHTHPEKNPSPSAIDINDWRKCIKRNPDRKLFFIVVGIEKTKIYTINENKFEELAAIIL